jgi:FKBP-type peptidyl-prolyl cis-trans isomerase
MAAETSGAEAKVTNVTEDGGIVKKILREGEGWQTPNKGADVTVHYVGTLLDGSEFDSSRGRGDPFKFKLGVGQVIKGWDQGVATMKKGELALLTCKSEYAYGASGSPPKIPPNATLQFEVELLSWTDEEDVSPTKDRGVLKKLLQEGDASGWETPREEAKITVKLSGKVLDGPEFEPEHTAEYVIGEEQIGEGLEAAISSLKKGQKARFTIKPQYAFGAHGDPARGIPPNATVVYEIELIDFAKEKESWDMSPEEKMVAALKRKDDGNELFKVSKFKRAVKKYKKALTFLDAEYGMTDEQKVKAKELKLPLYLNLAACKLSTKEYTEVLEDCKKALDIDPNNVKGLLRQAKANVELDEWDAAHKGFTRALELDPNNADVKREQARLKKKIADQTAKDKKVFGGMFEKFSK